MLRNLESFFGQESQSLKQNLFSCNFLYEQDCAVVQNLQLIDGGILREDIDSGENMLYWRSWNSCEG